MSFEFVLRETILADGGLIDAEESQGLNVIEPVESGIVLEQQADMIRSCAVLLRFGGVRWLRRCARRGIEKFEIALVVGISFW